MEGAPFSLRQDQPSVDEPSRAIDCPVSVLQNLRASVLGRFNSTPHGGSDVTGVLFGTRQGDEVRITAFCACSGEGEVSASGALEETQHAITAVISASRDQEEFAGLEPLGWFRAHPRCQLGLDERDLEIANTLFSEPWQVALVMRPGNSAATRVCFYFRDREGPWTADCAVRAFTVPAGDLEAAREFTGDPVEENQALTPTEPRGYSSTLLEPPEPRRPTRLPVLAVTMCVLAAVAGGVYYWFMRPQTLGLTVHLTDSAAQLRIEWDRTAGAIRDAKVGYVEIGDGGQVERVDLDASQLQIGYVNHQRQSNQVAVRLVVMGDGGSSVEEVTRFVAPAGLPNPTSAESVSNPASGGSGEGEAEKTPELVVPVPVDTVETEEEPAKSQPVAKFQPPETKRAQPPEQPPAPEVSSPAEMAHAPAPVLTSPVVHAEPPPEKPAEKPVEKAAEKPTGLIRRPALVSSSASAQPPTQSVARATAPRAAAAQSSGRVIWIGRLQKNQPVTISGRNASSGTLIGELPGRPFKFAISPGDLSSDGIVLYTANMQYANSVVEPPGAQNGWNKTVYTWNPKFANDVSIDETPGSENGWTRLVLHSKNPKISVIVIDWMAVN